MRTASLHSSLASPHLTALTKAPQQPTIQRFKSIQFGYFDEPTKRPTLKQRLKEVGIGAIALSSFTTILTVVESIAAREFAGPLKVLVDLFNK